MEHFKKTFNRTTVECKCISLSDDSNTEDSFNRTTVECKCGNGWDDEDDIPGL